MSTNHGFSFDAAGARDLLRRHGFTGASRDIAWQVEQATALLADAQVLLRDYGNDAVELADVETPTGIVGRLWSFSAHVGEDVPALWIAVAPNGEWRFWEYTPAHDDRSGGYVRSKTEARDYRFGVSFDHVTRDVLGHEFSRGDGQPFRQFDGNAAAARRHSPLETVIEGILQLAPAPRT